MNAYGIWKLLIFCLLTFQTINQVIAQTERITNYDVYIQINNDQSVNVIEEITVVATGEEIKRGIVRDLPRQNDVKSHLNNYKIIDVTRNGIQEPYKVEKGEKYLSIYIGEKSINLEPGTYTYSIEYTSADQTIIHKASNELYWNITGHDWTFPIEKSSCTVYLPDSSQFFSGLCYVGKYRDEANDCEQLILENNKGIQFTTIPSLAPKQGVTISVHFSGKPLPPYPWYAKHGVFLFWVFLSSMFGIVIFSIVWAFRKAMRGEGGSGGGFSGGGGRKSKRSKSSNKRYSGGGRGGGGGGKGW